MSEEIEKFQQLRKELLKEALEKFKSLPENDVIELCAQISNYVKKSAEIDALEEKINS